MEHKMQPAAHKSEKKGGYPAGSKPAGQIKPPPTSVSRPATRPFGSKGHE